MDKGRYAGKGVVSSTDNKLNTNQKIKNGRVIKKDYKYVKQI